MRVIVEQLVEWILAGETEVLGENLPQRHFVHHISHTTTPGLEPGSSHVRFVVDKVAPGQVYSEYFGLPCQSLFYQLLHNHPHLSSGVCTIGQKWPQYLGTYSHPTNNKKKDVENIICKNNIHETWVKEHKKVKRCNTYFFFWTFRSTFGINDHATHLHQNLCFLLWQGLCCPHWPRWIHSTHNVEKLGIELCWLMVSSWENVFFCLFDGAVRNLMLCTFEWLNDTE
jgi:hypothetical protein